MSLIKTRAFILRIKPFSETSSILYLFTQDLGLIHGLAKGIKRKKSDVMALERGFYIESIIYSKPSRDLHTLTNISIIDFFPQIRTNLYKSSIRDICFEVILSCMVTDSPNHDVFAYIENFLTKLKTISQEECFPFMIWKFFFDFSYLMGFGISLNNCAQCKTNLSQVNGCHLYISEGLIYCSKCSFAKSNNKRSYFLSKEIISFLLNNSNMIPSKNIISLSSIEKKKLNNIFYEYYKYHFQKDIDLKSLIFANSLL